MNNIQIVPSYSTLRGIICGSAKLRYQFSAADLATAVQLRSMQQQGKVCATRLRR